MLNYLASLGYLIAALLCMAGAVTGRNTGRSKGDMAVWISAAAMFGVLIAMRMLGGEDYLRGLLRGVAAGEGFYNTRWLGQVAAIILLAGLLGLGWHKIRLDWVQKRGSQTARFMRVVLLAMAGFALLYGLRLISLHAVDQLLYAGPLRLNWLLEGAFTLTIAAAAVFYIRHCRRRAAGRWVAVEDDPRKHHPGKDNKARPRR